MPFDDPQSNQTISNDPSPAITPPAPASPSTPPVQPLGANDTQQQSSPGNSSPIPAFQQNPNRSVRPNQDQASNAQPTSAPDQHPAVKRAGVMYSIAEALAGGPRYSEKIDESGNRQFTRVPVSGKHLALAIAMEAIQGSLTGLAAGRGRGPGAAGAAAFNQQLAQKQQQQQRQDQVAQQDADNRYKYIAQKASIAEVNSRTILNTSEAEKYGTDAIDRAVAINRESGVLDIDASNLDNNGQPMTQAEMSDAIKNGKISTMDQLGPIAGRVQITDKDGTTRWEATHLIIRDPNTPVPLTQEMWDRYASAHVPGFQAGVNMHDSTTLPLSLIQRANEVVAAHSLSDYRLKEIKDVLQGTPWADRVPASIDFSKPGVETAVQRFQKYVSHSNQHGMDVFESLQQMGADKRDPRSGQMQPNPDSKFVDTVAAAMGGWPVLQAVHNQLAADKKNATEFSVIDSESKANAVLASPNKFTRDQVSSAQNFLKLTQQQGAAKAAQEARQRAIAEGKDTEAMLKTGVNPITGEKLSLANAPDSMLVDSKGRPVPQNMQSFYKPSQNERQTADTARQAIAISADLRAAVRKNPNLIGPLLGNSKSGLAKLGFGDGESQKLLDDISFLQSAATKVHTGRFSSEILKKMGNMIKPGMNAEQFAGGLNSIDEVMNRYAKEDQLVTVADYKQMQQAPAGVSSSELSNLQVNPQTGQKIGWDGKQWVDANSRQVVK
jgi:hypothetical protein